MIVGVIFTDLKYPPNKMAHGRKYTKKAKNVRSRRNSRRNRRSRTQDGGGFSEDEITEIINDARCLNDRSAEEKEEVREAVRQLAHDPKYRSCFSIVPRNMDAREQAIDKIQCYCKYGDKIV